MFRYFKLVTTTIFFLFIFLVYLKNLSSSVYGGDIGDLVTAAYIFGVAHAPGYPLFTFLGFLFSHYFTFSTPAFRVGLISVFSSIITLIVYWQISYRLTKNYFVSLLSTSILAFSYLFWFYTELAEVFALNNLFAILIFYFAILFDQSKKIKYFFLLIFISSLSLTHHHTILFVFPTILLLLIKNYKILLKSKKNILIAIAIFLFGLSPYFYILIAASRNPVINWDNANNLTNLIHLILRKDYGTIKGGNYPQPLLLARFVILKDYFLQLISSITLPVFVISLIGILFLIKKNKIIAYSILITVLLSGPIFQFYAGFPVNNSFTIGVSERFYVLPSVVFLIFLPIGFLAIKNFFEIVFSKKIYSTILMLVFLLIPVMLFKYNIEKTALSKTNIGDNLVLDYLNPLPKNSVFYLSGDTNIFNTWYAHYVLKQRKDVLLIDSINEDGKKFIKEQERKTLKANKKIDSSYLELVLEIKKERPVSSISQFEIKQKNIVWVPIGLHSELYFKEDLPSEKEYFKQVDRAWKLLHIPKRDNLLVVERNLTLSGVPQDYASALVRIGNFINSQYQDKEKAIEFYKKAINVDKEYANAYAVLALLEFTNNNDCKSSLSNLNQAIDLNPIEEKYYLFLYGVYNGCKVNDKKINDLKLEFFKIFNKKINTEYINLLKES